MFRLLSLIIIFLSFSSFSEELPEYNEAYITSLSEWEGVNNINVDRDQLSNIVEEIVLSKGLSPNAETLLRASRRTSKKTNKDVFFVLHLFASSLSDKEVEAFKLYEAYDLPLSVADNRANYPKELLKFSYGWLINNTGLYIKEGFIKAMPELIDKSTPYWGATRDGYFRIKITQPNNFYASDYYAKFKKNVGNAFNPGRCNFGSMVNARYKSHVLVNGLLAIAPNYYVKSRQSKVQDYGWIDYWRYLGEYEWNVYNELSDSKKNWNQELSKQLQVHHNLDVDTSINAATFYSNEILSIYFGSRYEDTLVDTLTKYDNGGLRFLADAYFDQNELQVLGGYILREGTQSQLIEYFKWLHSKNNPSAIKDLFNHLVASNKYPVGGFIPYIDFTHVEWGMFDKTPFMYAIQHSNITAYQSLKEDGRFDLISNTKPEKEADWRGCNIPSVGKRNVLTYALEYGSKDIIEQVLKDTGAKLAPQLDTDKRTVVYYLSRNKKLSNTEFNKVVNSLYGYGAIQYNPSFNCKKSRQSIELLTCSSESNSVLDNKLAQYYKTTLNKQETEKTKKQLLDEQRVWLKKRMQCIAGFRKEGFKQCYNSRIKELSSIN